MSQNLTKNSTLAAADADKKSIKGGQLNQATVREGDDVTLYRERRPDDKTQWFGHGGENRMSGNTAHKYADLVASGDGSGTEGDQLQGDIIVAITDSDGRILAERQFGDSQELADAADDARTERPTQPAVGPVLGQGRYAEVIFNADAESDGAEVDPANSTARVWYSEA